MKRSVLIIKGNVSHSHLHVIFPFFFPVVRFVRRQRPLTPNKGTKREGVLGRDERKKSKLYNWRHTPKQIVAQVRRPSTLPVPSKTSSHHRGGPGGQDECSRSSSSIFVIAQFPDSRPNRRLRTKSAGTGEGNTRDNYYYVCHSTTPLCRRPASSSGLLISSRGSVHLSNDVCSAW